MDITAPIKPPPQKRRRKSLLLRFLGFAFAAGMIVFVAGSLALGYVLWTFSRDLPDYEVLAKYEPPVMTRVHAHDGALIAEYAHERRIYVPINAIPDKLIHAVLSAEDKTFFEHGGLDFQGIARALYNRFVKGQRLTGASTITQQVAKNFLLTNERTIDRKIKEAILAIRIERAFTKEQILELYMNEIFLGLKSYGVAAAALNYYGKSLGELTVAEAAYLAALPKAPNNYHPFRKTEAAISRRNWVLERMVANGYISRKVGDEARAEPLAVNPRPFGAHIFAAEFFAEDVRRTLTTEFGEKTLYQGGLSVRATLDPVLQRYARKALIDGLVRYDRRHGWRGPVQKIDMAEKEWGAQLAGFPILNDIKPWRMGVVLKADAKQALVGLRPTRHASGRLRDERETVSLTYPEVRWARPKLQRGLGRTPKTVTEVVKPGDVIYVAPTKDKKGKDIWTLVQIPEVEGAIAVMDPHTGRVLALVGGFSFSESQFDRAVQAKRQPGSSFKPFVYAAALDNGYTPTSIILDEPLEIEQGPGQEVWRPQNYGKKFYGPSTMRVGIERSRNLMTVRLARDMGMPLIREYADRFGIYDNLMPVLSMALGAGETTLLRMTAAYCVLANGGKKVTPSLIDRIQDRYGRTVWRHDKRECTNCSADTWNDQAEPVVPDTRRQIIDPHTAYQVTSMLEGVVQRGTAQRVKTVGKPLAGKTGTTNDEKDAWFVGFAPDLAVGVFVGFDNPKPMGKGETGGAVASPIFRDFMKMALADKPAVPFRIPPGINLIKVDLKTGFRAAYGSKRVIMEAFKPGTGPQDSYSSLGYRDRRGGYHTDGFPGRDRALSSGTGGLY